MQLYKKVGCYKFIGRDGSGYTPGITYHLVVKFHLVFATHVRVEVYNTKEGGYLPYESIMEFEKEWKKSGRN